MKAWHHMALTYPCLLAVETMHPRFRRGGLSLSVIVTVNTGYE